jgi:tetratricopeptide (TPR) repeat protein
VVAYTQSVEEAHALDSLASGVFVGRQRELGELKAALEDSLSGRGRLVMLVGEPGIGKTRTALELGTYAGLRRAQVLWGRCYETEGAPPYWPWVQAIRTYVREHDLEQLRTEMGSGAAEIAEVVPDVAQRFPDLPPVPAPADPQQARFRLFDSITTFLKSAARTQPLVLVLDDLHWADAGSLLLLEFAARELGGARLLIVGTYRDVELSRRHPLSRTLGELNREHLFTRVPLRGLATEDVGRFIEVTAGVSAPRELVAVVHAQTEGNPLFVTEVVRLLVQEGELASERRAGRDSWTVRIPEGVREVIGRRLDRLSERCNETLTVAAVLGREFTIEQLSGLIDDVSEDRLLEVLEEALAARVIEEPPHAVGRYQFTHGLIRETLVDELSSTRRARLHARIAQGLEELYGEGAGVHAAELAHHFAEAEAVLGPERVVRYSLLAGDAALAAHAHEEAATHFERGLATKDGQPVDAEMAALLFGLGRAQLGTLETRELQRSVESMRRAFEYYAGAGDLASAVSVGSFPLPPSFGLAETGLTEMLGRALGMVEPGSHDEGRLLCTYGWYTCVADEDQEAGRKAFERAIELAQRYGDTALETRTLVNAAHIDWLNTDYGGCLEKGLKAIELAEGVEDPLSGMGARGWVTRTFVVRGDSTQARTHADATLAFAEKLRQGWLLSTARGNLALLAILDGDWEAAREMLGLGLTGEPRDPRQLGLRAVLESELGELARGREVVDRLVESAREVPPPGPTAEHAFVAAYVPLVGRIAGSDHGFAAAVDAAERVLALPRVIPVVEVLVRTGLGLIAVQRGDADAARLQYGALQSQRGMAIPFLPLTADRLLGLLAATAGQLDAARDHLERALAFCRATGYRPELAWSASDSADLLDLRSAPDDAARAVALREEALAISRELGMRPLMERILARRQILKA